MSSKSTTKAAARSTAPVAAAGRTRAPAAKINLTNRDRILEVAEELFCVQGYDAVSTAQIAEVADTSQSVVLYHFKTKELLWREAMRQLFSRIDMLPRVDSSIYKDLDSLARLRLLLRQFVTMCARVPNVGRVILREGAGGGARLDWLIEELAGPYYEQFNAIVRELMGQGMLKAYDPVQVTLMLHGAAAIVFNLSPLSERLMGASPFSDAFVTSQADMVVDVLLNGLAAKA